jgi:outer membrane protein TolC
MSHIFIHFPGYLKQYLFVSALVFNVSAAEHREYAYPLEQILAIAESNAKDLTIIETETDAGLAEVDIYKSELFPNISFESGLSFISQSQKAQKMQLAMMTPTFGAVTPSGDESEIIYPNRNNGSKFNWSLTLQQPLNFIKLNTALKLSRIINCSLKDQNKQKKDHFYLRVIQEFLTVYLAQLNVTIHTSAIDRSKQLKNRKESEFNAGREIKRELLRMESTLQGDRARLFAAQCSLEIARKKLLQTINFKDDPNIVLEIDERGKMYEIPNSSGPGNIQLFLKHNEAAFYKEQTNYIFSRYFPNINFIGTIGNQYMVFDTSELLRNFIKPGTPYESALLLGERLDDNNPMPSSYFDPAFFTYTIGLQLSWDLFNGNRVKAQYRQAKLKAKLTLLELDTLENRSKIAIEENRYQIATIDSMIAAVTLQVEASHQAILQTEQDFNDGIIDYSTLLDVDKEYRDAVYLLNGLKIQRVLGIAYLRIAMGLPVYGGNQ